MNKLWFFMITSSLLALIFIDPSVVLTQMIDASGNAFSLCLQFVAIYALWLGILEIVDKSGLADVIAKFLQPIIKFLFRTKNKQTQKTLALAMSANLLGLGNAATPLGIKAMQQLEDGSDRANFSVIMLIIIITTSIQLLPTTTLGMLAKAGADNPSTIILPSIISTTITTLSGILMVFLIDKFLTRKKI